MKLAGGCGILHVSMFLWLVFFCMSQCQQLRSEAVPVLGPLRRCCFNDRKGGKAVLQKAASCPSMVYTSHYSRYIKLSVSSFPFSAGMGLPKNSWPSDNVALGPQPHFICNFLNLCPPCTFQTMHIHS